MYRSCVRTLWIALVALALGTSAAAAQPVKAELVAQKAAYTSADPLKFTLTIRNVSSSEVAVLRYKLPFEGVEDDIFVVSCGGRRVPYVGRLYKRTAPTAADWVRIPAGRDLSGSVDLAESYATGEGGNCSVQFNLAPASVRVKGAAAPKGTVLSDPVLVIVDPRALPEALLPEDVNPFALTPTYTSCSAARKTLLKTALTSAQSYASEGYSFLVNNAKSTTRYTRWFGTYTTSRYTTVKGHYSRMKNAIAGKTFSFDCSCSSSNVYAYVYPTRPYKVYLCGAFWRARNTGQDSKAGTLIHETSHFDIIGNTNDYIYGASGARWLAQYHPAQAVFNADNHEYFVELK